MGCRAQSEHRTFDPEEADFFYVPTYVTCLLHPVQGWVDFPWYYGPVREYAQLASAFIGGFEISPDFPREINVRHFVLFLSFIAYMLDLLVNIMLYKRYPHHRHTIVDIVCLCCSHSNTAGCQLSEGGVLVDTQDLPMVGSQTGGFSRWEWGTC